MDVDANEVINKLLEQIKQMTMAIAVKDVQIDLLQQQVAKLSAKE